MAEFFRPSTSGSRPGTGASRPGTSSGSPKPRALDFINATGKAPPTTSRGASPRTASRWGGATPGSAARKEAILGYLVAVMREKFAGVTKDLISQDVIGQEVVAYINANPDMEEPTDADMAAVEEKIKARLQNAPPPSRGRTAGYSASPPRSPAPKDSSRPGTGSASLLSPSAASSSSTEKLKALRRALQRGEEDEWSVISKFEAERMTVEERKKKEIERERQLLIKKELDVQILERELRKQKEKEEDMAVGKMLEADVERHKEEEKRKEEERMQVQQRLKEEREIQRKEMAAAREAESKERERAEEEIRNKAVRDTLKFRADEEAAREAAKARMKAMIEENERNKAVKQEQKAALAAEDIKRQEEFAKAVEAQERARTQQFEKIKEYQAKKFELALQREPPRFNPEEWEAKYAKLREEKLVLEEQNKLKEAEEKAAQMKRMLAQQLKEKEERRKQVQMEEAEVAEMIRVNNEQLAAQKEAARKLEAEKKLKIRAELEAQIR
eukprot:jgi/Mesvir1/23223/Mv22680-RA.1